MNYWLKKLIQVLSSLIATVIAFYIADYYGVRLNTKSFWLYLIVIFFPYYLTGEILPKNSVEKSKEELKNQSKKIDVLKREKHISSSDKLIDDDEINKKEYNHPYAGYVATLIALIIYSPFVNYNIFQVIGALLFISTFAFPVALLWKKRGEYWLMLPWVLAFSSIIILTTSVLRSFYFQNFFN